MTVYITATYIDFTTTHTLLKKVLVTQFIKRSLIVLLILAIGGVAGYLAGASKLTTPAPVSIERTQGQILADTLAHRIGDDREELRVVTDPSVVMDLSPNSTTDRCSVDYGGTMRRLTELPEEFRRYATEIAMETPGVTNVLLTYRAPAKETGRLYANTPTCVDGQLIATTNQTFEQGQLPIAR